MALAVSRARGIAGEQRRALAASRLAHRDALRLYLRAGTHALQAVHDDGLARGESRLQDTQPVDDGTELHRPILDLVALVHHQYVTHGLVRTDGAVVHQHCIVLSTAEELDAGEETGRELPLVIL